MLVGRVVELKRYCDTVEREHQEAERQLREEIRNIVRQQCRNTEPSEQGFFATMWLVLKSLFILSPLGYLFMPSKHKLARVVLEELRQA